MLHIPLPQPPVLDASDLNNHCNLVILVFGVSHDTSYSFLAFSVFFLQKSFPFHGFFV